MAWTPKLEVGNLDQWGRLVKSWATHQDYIGQGYPNQPPRNYSVRGYPLPPPPNTTTPDTDATGAPRPWTLPAMAGVVVAGPDGTGMLPKAVAISRDRFLALLAAANVVVAQMPDQYDKVIVVQGDEHTMVLRLPPMDTLQGSEDDLLNGRPYPFSTFYNDYYVTGPRGAPMVPVAPTPPSAHADIMELHAFRIGEYTLNNCN